MLAKGIVEIEFSFVKRPAKSVAHFIARGMSYRWLTLEFLLSSLNSDI